MVVGVLVGEVTAHGTPRAEGDAQDHARDAEPDQRM
jgi:hypothetical protein